MKIEKKEREREKDREGEPKSQTLDSLRFLMVYSANT